MNVKTFGRNVLRIMDFSDALKFKTYPDERLVSFHGEAHSGNCHFYFQLIILLLVFQCPNFLCFGASWLPVFPGFQSLQVFSLSRFPVPVAFFLFRLLGFQSFQDSSLSELLAFLDF